MEARMIQLEIRLRKLNRNPKANGNIIRKIKRQIKNLMGRL